MAPVKILVVDDDRLILEFCRLSLNDKYEVRTAFNGREALIVLENYRPDVIVTDIDMPLMDGLTLSERLGEMEDLKEIPVIIMTGLTSDSLLPPGFWKIGARADAYLHKPVERFELRREVEKQIVRKLGIDPDQTPSGGYL